MDRCPWRQVNVAFPDYVRAEPYAVAHLAPLLTAAELDGLIASWFFIRKAPCWRVRYLPAGDADEASAYIHRHISDLLNGGYVADVTEIVYEPEAHAFGGVQGMTIAHRLFHFDSWYLLAYLADSDRTDGARHRRELSILFCTGLLRAAGLDWYEQGDVWARVAEHRESPNQLPPGEQHKLETALRQLMSVDTTSLMGPGSSLAFAAEWAQAYAAAGRELAGLNARGRLHRGLRGVLAHHIVFAWNRLGLPSTAQAVLAGTAKTVAFGPDPTLSPTVEPYVEEGKRSWTAPAGS